MNRPSGRKDAVIFQVRRGADEKFSLTESQEDELLEAMAEIERGEFVTLDELFQSERNGIPHLPRGKNATPVTLDLVNQLRDEEP